MGAMWHPGTRMLAESYDGNKESHHGGYGYFLLIARCSHVKQYTRWLYQVVNIAQTQVTRCVTCVYTKDEIEMEVPKNILA